MPDLIVLHEHPEWQKPLFAALERRGIAFAPFDLTRAAFSNTAAPLAPLYFNQASPSAYVRGNTRAVLFALAYMRSLERLGARVLNGADVFALELSKSAQATLLRTMGIDTPWSITFNDASALWSYAGDIRWPAILKPDQGGSGARIHVVESLPHLERILAADPGVWLPDNLLLLQEYLPHDPEQGIVRLEFQGLYVVEETALEITGLHRSICMRERLAPGCDRELRGKQDVQVLAAQLLLRNTGHFGAGRGCAARQQEQVCSHYSCDKKSS